MRNSIFYLLRVVRALIFPSLFALSIVANLAMLFSATAYGAAQSLAGAMTGTRSIVERHADEITKLSSELDAEKAANRQVRNELAKAQGELVSERAASRKVRSELTETSAELAAARALQRQTRAKVVGTASTVTKRAARTATREVASMPGEALPVLGTAVIIGATALELADLCQTIKDMTALQQALDADFAEPPEQLTVCTIKVPSRKKLTAMAYDAPEQAWSAAKEFVPELMSADVPDIDWDKSKNWLSSTYDGLSEKAASTGGDIASWAERWWNDDE